MNTKGESKAWAAPMRATPASKFSSYEEAVKTHKFDKVFDRDWSFNEALRTRAKNPRVNARVIADRADTLESLLGL